MAQESLEEVGVDLLETFPFVGQIIGVENRFDGTDRRTKSAIDALVGINIHLRRIGVGLDAIGGTNIGAGAVFDADAGLSDNVRHNA